MLEMNNVQKNTEIHVHSALPVNMEINTHDYVPSFTSLNPIVCSLQENLALTNEGRGFLRVNRQYS